MAVSNDAKVIPALRDQLTKLESIVKQKWVSIFLRGCEMDEF